VGPTPALASHEWGTQVDMSCSYTGGTPTATDYSWSRLAATGTVTRRLGDGGGAAEQHGRGSWSAPQPAPGDIRSLEIRTGTGRPVLRLTL